MLNSVDQVPTQNTFQPLSSPQSSVFTRQSMTVPTAIQTPQLSPTNIPQIPMNYSPRYAPSQQASQPINQQMQYQTNDIYNQGQEYRTDQDNGFQPEEIANTVQDEVKGFINWLFRF
jgi:hypothetical protein